MYIDAPNMSGLDGFMDTLKKAVKKKYTVVKKVAKKVGPLDPGAYILQRKYGRTIGERKANVAKAMHAFDKVSGESTSSKKLMRVLDPSSKILDEVANAQKRLQEKGLAPRDNTFLGKARRWVSPASYLHRSDGPIRRKPVMLQTNESGDQAEVVLVPEPDAASTVNNAASGATLLRFGIAALALTQLF